MRAWWAALGAGTFGIVASCGLDVAGEPAGVVTPIPDAATDHAAPSDGGADAAPDAPVADTFCKGATIAGDPGVRFCLDFDPASPPTFGFDEIPTEPTATVGLVTSPLGAAAGKAFDVGLTDAAKARNARWAKRVLSSGATLDGKTLTLDADVSIHDDTLAYADVALFEIAGNGCFVRPGVHVEGDQLYGNEPASAPVDHVARPAGPFHLHVETTLQPSAQAPMTITVDATVLSARQVDYTGCTDVALAVGAFATDDGLGHVGVTFDQIVVRLK